MDDYKTMLNRMRAQRSTLDQAIAAIEKLVGEGNGTSAAGGIAAEVAPDDFYGMSLVEASKKYLQVAGRPARSTDEIVAALPRGGLRDVSKDSLAAVLLRAAKGGEIRKVGKGYWGLKAWYPEGVKNPPKRRTTEKQEEEPETPETGDQEPT